MFLHLFLKKNNPYRDEVGRFSSKDGHASTVAVGPRKNRNVHEVIAGVADQFAKITDIQTLRKKSGISDAGFEAVTTSLKTEAEQREYLQNLGTQNTLYGQYKTTKFLHSKSGNGDGYTDARRKVHSAILDKVFANHSQYIPAEGEAPSMTILGGRGGSGKSNFDSDRNKDVGGYSAKKALVLDPDKFKEALPDYDPNLAGVFHEESSSLFERAVSKARSMGIHVVLDLTMKSDPTHYVDSFKRAGYETKGLYMHKPAQQAAASAVNRWRDAGGGKRGRMVPVDIILGNVHNEDNFKKVSAKVSSWEYWDHSGKEGVFTRVARGGKTKKSDGFSQVFKACASLVQSIADPESQGLSGFLHVLKINAYHDERGRFTTKDKASFVSIGTRFDKFHSKDKEALAAQKAKEAEEAKAAEEAKKAKAAKAKKPKPAEAKDPAEGLPKPPTPAPEVPDTLTSPEVAKLITSLSSSTASDVKKAIERAKAGDLLGLKDSINTLNKIKWNTDAAKLSAHFTDYLSKKAEFADWQQENLDFEPTFSGLTPKKREAAKVAAAALAAGYSAAREKYLAAKVETKAPTLTAIKTSAKELVALQKAMEKTGMSKEDIALVNAKASTAFIKEREDFRAKASEAVKSAARKAFELGEPDPNSMADYVDYGYIKGQSAPVFDFNRPGLLGMSASKWTRTHVENVKTEAAVQLAELYKKKDAGESVNAQVDDLTSRVEKTWGTHAVVPLNAMAKELAGIESMPKTKAEALDAVMKAYKDAGMAAAQSYEDFKLVPASSTESKAKALKAYAAAHFGVQITSDMTQTLYKEGYSEFSDIVTTKKAVINSAKASLTAALTSGLMSKALGGEVDRTSYMQYQQAKTSLKELGVSDDSIAYYAAQAKEKHKKAVSALALDSASRLQSAELQKALKEAAGEDFSEAVAKIAQVKTKYKNFLTEESIAAAEHSAKQTAKFHSDASKVKASVVSDYDSKDFAEVHGQTAHATGFKEHHKNFVASLTDAEKANLTAYTGSSFTTLNRKAGAYGTSKMSGGTPTALSPSDRQVMLSMDAAFAKTSLGKDVKLRRNMAAKYLAAQLGLPERSHEWTDDQIKSLEGRIYKETAYSSTSKNLDFNSSFSEQANITGKVALFIRSSADKPGLDVSSISLHGHEAEVVLPRGTTYVIRRVHRDSYGDIRIDVDNIGVFPDPL